MKTAEGRPARPLRAARLAGTARGSKASGSRSAPPGSRRAAPKPLSAAAAEIIAGLAAPDPFVFPKYFYDVLGSRLFEAITALPEYYPTRTEGAILDRRLGEIARSAGAGTTLIDLGAGNCDKGKRLIQALKPGQYVAVDISAEFLDAALTALKREHPGTQMLGIGADISSEIALPPQVRRNRRLFAYLGSSIGNFMPDHAAAMLARIRAHCHGRSGLLIGVDLRKPARVLEAAYDDALGVTAAFNLNLLNHLNRLAGSDFDVRDWRHRARFDAGLSRIEMHLEARRDVRVRWPGGGRAFAKGQRIHTENSYKYTLRGFAAMLRGAGFGPVESWTDDDGWFALFLAHAKPRPASVRGITFPLKHPAGTRRIP